MFKFKNLVICPLFFAINLSLAFSQSQAAAGLFDLRSSKRKAAAAAAGKASESQADAPAIPGQGSAGRVSLASYADDGSPEASVPAPPPASVYHSASIPAYPLTSTPFEVADSSCQCVNCGQDDHCQSCVRNCRKKCKQTWYPRVAPYCQPGWGWNQPCWRRTADTYHCPRPQQLTSPRRRVGIPESPAEEAPADAPILDVMPETPADELQTTAPALPRESAARR